MSTNTVTVNKTEISYISSKYTDNVIKNNRVIEGSFYQAKPITIREMVTRKINKSLSFCLMVTIVITFVSYYIAMNYEAKLNNLDKEIVQINTENQDLQTDLDRYKSFNNVDTRIGELQLLQKADKVIEVMAMSEENTKIKKSKNISDNFNWSLGY